MLQEQIPQILTFELGSKMKQNEINFLNEWCKVCKMQFNSANVVGNADPFNSQRVGFIQLLFNYI